MPWSQAINVGRLLMYASLVRQMRGCWVMDGSWFWIPLGFQLGFFFRSLTLLLWFRDSYENDFAFGKNLVYLSFKRLWPCGSLPWKIKGLWKGWLYDFRSGMEREGVDRYEFLCERDHLIQIEGFFLMFDIRSLGLVCVECMTGISCSLFATLYLVPSYQ